jgi:hypothetical protein
MLSSSASAPASSICSEATAFYAAAIAKRFEAFWHTRERFEPKHAALVSIDQVNNAH